MRIGKSKLKINKGKIFVLSGPSGSGKTTLRDLILKESVFKRIFVKSVSLSTRQKRLGEKHGRDYFFISKKEFLMLRRDKKILEWTRYLGYYYGTKKETVDISLSKGKNILLCLDLRGALRIKKLYPKDSVTIFVIPPSIRELHNRLKGRCAHTGDDEITKRVKLARLELRNSSKYDYTLRNANLVSAVKRLKDIIFKQINN